MHQDNARMINDLHTMLATIVPDIDSNKLSLRLEEIVSNYNIQRKSFIELENDIFEKIDMFIASKKLEGLSSITLYDYKLDLSNFGKVVNKPVVQITTPDIRMYLASKTNWKMSTLDTKLSILKTFFGWMVKEEVLLRDPTAKINPPKKEKRLPKGLSIEELESIRESCKTSRERALIEMFYSTGCRLSEIANMKIADVNYQAMNMRVIGKGNKERVVYLSFKSIFHLKKYLDERNDTCEFIFVTQRKPSRKMSNRSIQDEINKIEKRVSLSGRLTPHVLRHTFAQLSMDAGIELTDLQHLMGHSSPATTLIYGSVSEERKRQAYQKYHVM